MRKSEKEQIFLLVEKAIKSELKDSEYQKYIAMRTAEKKQRSS